MMIYNIRVISAVFLSVFVFCLASAEVSAQDDQEKMRRQLERLMAGESELTEDDVKIYLNNIDKIFALRFEPDKLPEVAKSVEGWSERRFAYVSTKMAVGMHMLIKPDSPINVTIPDFAKPTGQERDLIKRYQDSLNRAMERVQAKYAAGSGS